MQDQDDWKIHLTVSVGGKIREFLERSLAGLAPKVENVVKLGAPFNEAPTPSPPAPESKPTPSPTLSMEVPSREKLIEGIFKVLQQQGPPPSQWVLATRVITYLLNPTRHDAEVAGKTRKQLLKIIPSLVHQKLIVRKRVGGPGTHCVYSLPKVDTTPNLREENLRKLTEYMSTSREWLNISKIADALGLPYHTPEDFQAVENLVWALFAQGKLEGMGKYFRFYKPSATPTPAPTPTPTPAPTPTVETESTITAGSLKLPYGSKKIRENLFSILLFKSRYPVLESQLLTMMQQRGFTNTSAVQKELASLRSLDLVEKTRVTIKGQEPKSSTVYKYALTQRGRDYPLPKDVPLPRHILRAEEVLRFMRRHKAPVTYRQIDKGTGISYFSLSKPVTYLRSMGKVKCLSPAETKTLLKRDSFANLPCLFRVTPRGTSSLSQDAAFLRAMLAEVKNKKGDSIASLRDNWKISSTTIKNWITTGVVPDSDHLRGLLWDYLSPHCNTGYLKTRLAHVLN